MLWEIQMILQIQVMLDINMENHFLQVWLGVGKVMSNQQAQHKPECSSILLLPLIKTVLNQLMPILVQMEELQ